MHHQGVVGEEVGEELPLGKEGQEEELVYHLVWVEEGEELEVQFHLGKVEQGVEVALVEGLLHHLAKGELGEVLGW